MANQSSTPFDQGLFLVHLNRGREFFDARNFGDAAEELEEARRLRPGDDTVLNLLGLAYFKQEKFREADSVYRKLIDLNPESSTLYFNLGLVCFKLADLDRAEATFLRALELKPDNQKTHFYLGNIYEKKKQYYNAIFQYRKAGANIMVKRVQEKIDRERPAERHAGEDFGAPTPNPDDTRPKVKSQTPEETTAPNVLDRVNVDTVDRRRILSALQQDLLNTNPSGRARDIPRRRHDAPSEKASGRGRASSDTEETLVLDDESDTVGNLPAETFAEETSTEDTIPPPHEGVPGASDTTRIRLSEPLLQDESLAEMARSKTPRNVSADLFSRPAAERGRPVIMPPPDIGDRTEPS